MEKSFNLNLSEAPFQRQFHYDLVEQIKNDKDSDNKIYGQCTEMASLLNTRRQYLSDNIYIIQLPNANHTITLISESNYSERQPIMWENEYSPKGQSLSIYGTANCPLKTHHNW